MNVREQQIRERLGYLLQQAAELRGLSDFGLPSQPEFLSRRNSMVEELLDLRCELKRTNPELRLLTSQAMRMLPPQLTREQAKFVAKTREKAEEFINRKHGRDELGHTVLVKQLREVISILHEAFDGFPDGKVMKRYLSEVESVYVSSPKSTAVPKRRSSAEVSGGLPGLGLHR